MSTEVERAPRPGARGHPDRSRPLESVHSRALRGGRPPPGRRDCRRRARWPAGPASTPAARRTTSSSSASRRARRRSPGARSTVRWSRRSSTPLHQDLLASLAGKELFVLDCYAGADPDVPAAGPRHQRVRLAQPVLPQPVHRRPGGRRRGLAGRSRSSIRRASRPIRRATAASSDVVIALNFAKKLVLIGGTSYAGEMKKSIFTVLNYILPLQNVLSMHCSANIGAGGDMALFFGLSGTGKTTLSSDPDRMLIGDDEHGWSDRGVFNFEGGCYAKTIRLSAEAEPQIYATTRRFGTVLENVVVDEARASSISTTIATPRTRARRIRFRSSTTPCRPARAAIPRNVVMLTADAFGVLPPISRLTPAGRDVSLPVRLHRQGRGHRERGDRAEGDVQHLLRRAVPAAGAEPLRADARREDRAAPARASGWSTPAGPAGRTASASA